MELQALKKLNLCSMIECNTLSDDNWINSFWKYWRNVNNNPSSPIGGVPSLRPVGVSAPKNASMITMLELLAFLQLSDCNDVLIFHTISIRESDKNFKHKKKALVEGEYRMIAS